MKEFKTPPFAFCFFIAFCGAVIPKNSAAKEGVYFELDKSFISLDLLLMGFAGRSMFGINAPARYHHESSNPSELLDSSLDERDGLKRLDEIGGLLFELDEDIGDELLFGDEELKSLKK